MSESLETRCNALESYCAALEQDLESLRQKYTDLEKNYAEILSRNTALQEVAKVATSEKNITPSVGFGSGSRPRAEYTSKCSRCHRGMSGQQTMQVWDGRLGQHVTKKSTLCDSCQRSSVVMF